MEQTNSKRALVRKRNIHAKNAAIAAFLFNHKKAFVISGVNGQDLRINPDSPYYDQLKELLGSIGCDHIGKRTYADLAIDGQLTDPEILQRI